MPRREPNNTPVAEAIGLKALIFLTSDGARLARFLAATGLDAGELSAKAGQKATLAAVLAHLLEDEALLLVFSAECAIAPEAVAPAEAALAGGIGEEA